MSISNLFSPNNYNLNCNNFNCSTVVSNVVDTNTINTNAINLPGDVPLTSFKTDIFNGANKLFDNGCNISYLVKGGICYVIVSQTTLFNLNTFQLNLLNIGSQADGYMTLPAPSLYGNDIRGNLNIETNSLPGHLARSCYFFLDGNIGGVPEHCLISLYLTPTIVTTPNPDTGGIPYTYTAVPGSTLFSGNTLLYSFTISYPVA